MKNWDIRGDNYCKRMAAASKLTSGKVVNASDAVALLEATIHPFDKVNIEGDNQKQADFLAKALSRVDPHKVHDLHMVQSAVVLPDHLDIFEKGIAKKLDFSYSAPQGKRLAQMVQNGLIQMGSVHTYLELYGRYFTDLTPDVCLIVGFEADSNGNLFTGGNTEDTPAIVEATKFRKGIVIAQVNKIVENVPRVDIPGGWVDFVIESPDPFELKALFTRDPAKISNKRILKAMMAIHLYAEYGVQTLNHGIGYDTCAIELLLPTYGNELNLKGKICQHFILNPIPTMIPAIEDGWVKSIHSPGSEAGMEEYVKARPDVFFVGPEGELRSNRVFTQIAGHYAIDMFIGSTLQIDQYGNSSTATKSTIAGFGGAPNMGCDSRGRRHDSPGWLKCGDEWAQRKESVGDIVRGRRLVVQMLNTVSSKGFPGFVEHLDAIELAEKAKLTVPPVMIYGDDLTHIITEKGVAYLHKCSSLEERMAAIRGVAGDTPIGRQEKKEETEILRARGIIKLPADYGIDVERATQDLLAAHSIGDIVTASGGIYTPPAGF